ncbi:MAG TPA: septum formation initiator family protein, partial [Candidatus Saccharimonadales bacterium]|nr:septum formation initiator family protein [Candidatus Saccharimonadales bacterium]
MFTKIKIGYYRIKGIILQLRDVRVVGLLLFLIVVLMISWSGIKAIETNYQLQKEIAQLKDQTDLQQLVNENQRLENGYFDTPQYLELAAREDFGLAAPGESVVIVPKSVALAH